MRHASASVFRRASFCWKPWLTRTDMQSYKKNFVMSEEWERKVSSRKNPPARIVLALKTGAANKVPTRLPLAIVNKCKNEAAIVKFRPNFLSSSRHNLESLAAIRQEVWGRSHGAKVKQIDKTSRFLSFFADKSNALIGLTHWVYFAKTQQKLQRIDNQHVAKSVIFALFPAKKLSWKITQGEC